MNKYLECDKLADVSEQSMIIGQFLEWLSDEKQVKLAVYVEDFGSEGWPTTHRLDQYNKSIETILAEYFNIDLQKVELERREILEELRKQQSL